MSFEGLPVVFASSIVELLAVASSFQNATPKRIAENRTRIAPFERHCRLEKIISIYFVTTKQHNDVCQLTGDSRYGSSYIYVIKNILSLLTTRLRRPGARLSGEGEADGFAAMPRAIAARHSSHGGESAMRKRVRYMTKKCFFVSE
ncbi:MAG: hypothetical protein M3178_06210 [Pseudomonadota bacterium]|nr:hypothetical protein [Pseudomonadota bacterium]